MFFKRFQAFAEVVGFITLGLLMLFGALTLFNGTNPALAAIGLFAPQHPASAQAMPQSPAQSVPPVIGYLGNLKDAGGNPLSGTYTMTFRIYASAGDTITDALWSETHTGVNVSSGIFNVLLGSKETLPSSLFTDPNRLLGITVGTYDEIAPRQPFASVPYSMQADRAAGLSASDGDPADAVTVDADGQATFTQTATFNAGASIAGNADIGQDATIGGNAIVSGSVGIGTQPSETLVVKMGGQTWSDPHFALEAPSTTDKWDFTVGTNDTLYMGYNESTLFKMQTDGDFVVTEGKVGIGNDPVSEKLEVTGNIAATGDIIAENGNISAGGILIDGKKPVIFQEFTYAANVDTGIATADYLCGVVEYQALWGDIQENDAGDIIYVYLEDVGGTWHIRADFRSHNVHEHWTVTVMCVSTALAEQQ